MSSTWQNNFLDMLKNKRFEKVACSTSYNKLQEQLSTLKPCVLYTPGCAKNFQVVSTKYNILQIKQHYLCRDQIFFFDHVNVRRHTKDYGDFLVMKWSDVYRHMEDYSQVLSKHFKVDQVVVQDSVIINIPQDKNVAAKTAFARQFYSIKSNRNQLLYMTGQLVDKVHVEPHTPSTFDVMLSAHEEVNMIMGAVIEGIKQSKSAVEMITLNNKKILEKTYSFSIKPVIFFHIQ
ncbi:DNA binding protein [Clanis bilineata nucleopolyhedrovirus]|uniref:DNA binding protein n=1 Tax=Clanis bilineata nucleopolyhedrovirus TaxID=1307957 RepID=Q0N482_9ABAC|nr:DNA binding protein [Clanis bilineata nucleopolyhedrovirus]ABF47361.1 DNA binding protein [Clanis bilineata nucleopolyhedrovirus]